MAGGTPGILRGMIPPAKEFHPGYKILIGMLTGAVTREQEAS